MDASDFARTSAQATRLVVASHTGSTNADVLAGIAGDPADWPPYAVLLTDDQRAGRGRLDRVWTAEAGDALAASVVVSTLELPPASLGWIPLAAGAAMTRAVAAQLDGHTVRLKWPNDVLVDGLKLCGILVEAAEHGRAVIGAGVNTAMTVPPVPTATSFALLGREVDPDRLVADYLVALRELLTALESERGDADRAGVHGEVTALCGTLGNAVSVALPDGSQLDGLALAIGRGGELLVAGPAGEVAVTAGDVVHVRSA